MPAKFAGVCKTCDGPIEVGEMILWQKGLGARHQTCPQTEDSHEPIIHSDPTEYQDKKTYDFQTAKLLAHCQKCGNAIPRDEEAHLEGADGDGFRRVCKKCYR